MSYRSTQLLGSLAKQGLYNPVCHWMAAHGVTANSSNAVTNWLNVAPSNIALNQSLSQVTAASMPTLLAHGGGAGNNYGYTNGTSGYYFSTPDAAPLQITGDIEFIVRVALADWTSGGNERFISKRNATTAYDFFLNSASSDRPAFFDGSTVYTATAAPTVVDSQIIWLRCTVSMSGAVVRFYQAPDSGSIPTAWVQIGADVARTGTPLNNTSDAVNVGSYANGTQGRLNGRVYRAQIYNGINGTLAFDFNPATYTSGSTFTDSSANAATITLNGGAVINTAPSIYFDGVNDFLKTGAFTLNQPETVYLIGKQPTWTNGDKIFTGFSTVTPNRGQLRQSGVTPTIAAFAGSSAPSNSGLALQTNAAITLVLNGAISAVRVNNAAASTGDAGAEGMNGLTLGADADGTLSGNVIISEILVYSSAHNTAQQNAIIGYLMAKYGI